jgi:4'-phosphopantetheinyl transferase
VVAVAGDEVHVWEIALDEAVTRAVELGLLLSADERERAARFYFRADRDRWVLCRCALRSVVARYIGIPPKDLVFQSNAYGKPQLAPALQSSCPHFNLTHTRKLALLAVAPSEIGIDTEYINPDLSWQTLAPEVLSDCELSQLLDSPLAVQQRLFFEFWTRKEAYIKGRGLGLSLPLKAFHVSLTETGQISVAAPWDDGRPWRLFGLQTYPTHVAALAYAGKLSILQRFIWKEGDLQPLIEPG